MIQLNNFDSRLLKTNKTEIRESNSIYYISYKIIDQKIILIVLIVCILLLIICVVRWKKLMVRKIDI